MQFYPFVPNDMRVGAYGISEPAGGSPVAPSQIEAVVVPGVAFTLDGARLGRGKGFYDKYCFTLVFRNVSCVDIELLYCVHHFCIPPSLINIRVLR